MLPKIIFCESHFDPVSGIILTQIAPKLKNLGYEIYYDEAPSGLSLIWAINRFNDEENKEILKHKNELFPWINEDSSAFSKEQLNTLNKLKRAQADSELGVFFLTLRQIGFKYFAMDIPINASNESVLHTPDIIRERDQYMAEALLAEERATFSCIGAMHARGIQNSILEKISQEQAMSSFYFVNIYRDQPINEYESKLRKQEIFHPLGIHFFDAQKLSEDEIIDDIIQNVERLAKINQPRASSEILLHQSVDVLGSSEVIRSNLSSVSTIFSEPPEKISFVKPASSETHNQFYQAVNLLEKYGEMGENIKNSLIRLKKGQENCWNPYWMNSGVKLKRIIQAISSLKENDDLKKNINDQTSDLYKALNMQRIAPTFFGRLEINQAKSLISIKDEIALVTYNCTD